jgi:hypothetical protein
MYLIALLWSPISIALGCILLVSAVLFVLNRRQPGRITLAPGDTIQTVLNDADVSLFYSAPISTATFFEGTAPLNDIRERLSGIIKANPWISSRLLRQGKQYLLKFGKTWDDSLILHHFEAISDESLSSSLPLTVICKKLEGTLVSKGAAAVDRDVSLFKVTVVSNPLLKTFAVIVSSNHVLIDGRSYYHICNMLSSSGKVVPLNPFRDKQFDGELLSHSLSARLLSSFIFFIRYILFMLTPKTSQIGAYAVDKRWIATEKEKHNTSTAFVSTNDLIVSWFGVLTQPDFLLMPINFRGRISRLEDNLAGNYIGGTIMREPQYASPGGIRNAVRSCLSDNGVMPSILDILRFNTAIISNWTAFQEEMSLPNCRHIIHLPVFIVGSTRFPTTCVVFQPRDGETALLVGTVVPSIRHKLESAVGASGSPIIEHLINAY